MRTTALAAALLVALLAFPQALACPTTSTPQATTCSNPINGFGTDDLGQPCYYVVTDVCQPGCLYSIHIYKETNGIGGLQRGDSVVDDTCGGLIQPDTEVLL